MCSQTYRQRIVLAAQPARAGRFDRHQVCDNFRAIALQPGLFSGCKRLQKACDLIVARRNEYEAFALRALFKLEDALNSLAIVWVATQAVAGFGGIGDETTAFEVGFKTTNGDGNFLQVHLSCLNSSPPAPVSTPQGLQSLADCLPLVLPLAGEGCALARERE